MRVLSLETFSQAELLARLRQTRLRGFGQPEVYREASLELRAGCQTSLLASAQYYALRPNLEKILQLREALLEWELDILALQGGLLIRTSQHPEEQIPVLPPIVEESLEPDGRRVLLVADGIHRVLAARQLGLPLSILLVRQVPPQYPYYAYALEGGWEEMELMDELPDLYLKHHYRLPDNYRALYREYDRVFPGVQKARKDSDPEHLTALAPESPGGAETPLEKGSAPPGL